MAERYVFRGPNRVAASHGSRQIQSSWSRHLRAKYSLFAGVGALHAARAELVRSPL